MKHREGFFDGVRNHRIYYQCWLPETEPGAVLLVVHGLAEHGGRYMNLVNRFLPLGYAVYAADHIGHGRSEGARAHVERFADYTDTLAAFSGMVRGWHAGKPVFLVGHSMGGLIGALHLPLHQDELAGAVLSGPAVRVPDDLPPVILFAGRVLSAVAPRLGLIPLEAEGVSSDPAVVRAYESDPLVYRGKITARLGAEMVKAMEQVPTLAPRITLPLLILQGGADRLVNPAGAQLLYDGAASADRTIIVYEGFYHEVFNEPDHDRVLGDVGRWLERHAG